MMRKKKEIIKQAGIYTLGSQLTQLITLIAAVCSRKFLGPTQIGIWSTLQMVVEYSKYSALGATHSVMREIPYYIGKGKPEEAEQIKNTSYTVVLAGSCLAAALVCLFAVCTHGRFPRPVTYGLYFTAAIIVLQRLNDLFICFLRCYKKFALASSQMIWSAVVNALLVAFLSYQFKIYGFMFAVILSLTFNLGYMRAHQPFHLRWNWDLKRIRSLARFGLPLLAIAIMVTTLRSIDKVVIAKWMGFESLGFYSIAFMVGSYIGNFSNSFAIVLIPHFQEQFGIQDDPRDLKNFLVKSATAYGLIIPCVIGLGAWVAAPYFVRLWLPQFVPGIRAMEYLSLGIYFLSLAQPYRDFLIAIRKHWALFPFLALTFVAALAANAYALGSGRGIEAVALATGFTYAVDFSLIYFFASRYLMDAPEMMRRYGMLLGYGVYLVVVLALIRSWVPDASFSLGLTGLQAVLFILLYVPIFFVMEREFSVLKMLGDKMRTRT